MRRPALQPHEQGNHFVYLLPILFVLFLLFFLFDFILFYLFLINIDFQGRPRKDTHWMAETGVVDVFFMMGPSPYDVFSQYPTSLFHRKT